MNHRNYQKELDQLLEQIVKKIIRRHYFCTAAVLPAAVMYWNTSLLILRSSFIFIIRISPSRKNTKRKAELIRLVEENHYPNSVQLLDGDYDSRMFFEMAEGLEKEPECGRRCFRCYDMRLRKTAEMAVKEGADYFCTTLSISPHKNADKLMEIGEMLAGEYGIAYLPSDFKKKTGTREASSFPGNIIYTGRIIVAVCIQKRRHRDGRNANEEKSRKKPDQVV